MNPFLPAALPSPYIIDIFKQVYQNLSTFGEFPKLSVFPPPHLQTDNPLNSIPPSPQCAAIQLTCALLPSQHHRRESPPNTISTEVTSVLTQSWLSQTISTLRSLCNPHQDQYHTDITRNSSHFDGHFQHSNSPQQYSPCSSASPCTSSTDSQFGHDSSNKPPNHHHHHHKFLLDDFNSSIIIQPTTHNPGDTHIQHDQDLTHFREVHLSRTNPPSSSNSTPPHPTQPHDLQAHELITAYNSLLQLFLPTQPQPQLQPLAQRNHDEISLRVAIEINYPQGFRLSNPILPLPESLSAVIRQYAAILAQNPSSSGQFALDFMIVQGTERQAGSEQIVNQSESADRNREIGENNLNTIVSSIPLPLEGQPLSPDTLLASIPTLTLNDLIFPSLAQCIDAILDAHGADLG